MTEFDEEKTDNDHDSDDGIDIGVSSDDESETTTQAGANRKRGRISGSDSDSEENHVDAITTSRPRQNNRSDDEGSGNEWAESSDSSADEDVESIAIQNAVSDEKLDKARAMIAARESYWAESERDSHIGERPYDFLISTFRMLAATETPRAAMDRFLGRNKQQQKGPAFKSAIKAARRNTNTQSSTKSESAVKDINSFDRITEFCDILAGPGGIPGVLDLTKEALYQRLHGIRFEYRHSQEPNQNVSGPVNFETLSRLSRLHAIEFRRAGSSDKWKEFQK
jgi:hypothetical protein